ncbi:MAG: hypothetical protein KA164_21105, partial [Rhodoferax sp.]|nr:hypothetical protein [Rhodoferax sp.]
MSEPIEVPARPRRLPRLGGRLRARMGDGAAVLLGGCAIGLAILCGTAVFVHQERAKAIAVERQRAALLVYMFEGHLSRTLAAVDASMDAAGRQIVARGVSARGDIPAELQDLIRDAAYLRSVSLLNPKGEVVASSHGPNVGLRLTRIQLGLGPDLDRRVSLGRPLFVRDLDQLPFTPLAGDFRAGTPYGIPAVKIIGPEPEPWMLLAMVNPDYLLPDHQDVLNG